MSKLIKLIGIFIVMALLISTVPFAVLSEDTAANTSMANTSITASNNTGSANSSKNGIDLISSLSSSRSNEANPGDKLKNAIIMYIGSPKAYVNGVEKQIDPLNIEVTPTIINNVEMVPVRFIAESLGGSVRWDQKSLTASIALGNKSYKFTQGSNTMTAGYEKHDLGVAVQAYNGRTFVPMDKFVEVLGMKVFYDRGLIIISDEDNIFDSLNDKALVSEWIAKLSYLPVVGSQEKLISLLEEGQDNETYYYGGIIQKSIEIDIAPSWQQADVTDNGTTAANEASSGSTEASRTSGNSGAADGNESIVQDYSTTNVQVQGVDEADIVKTDGSYIYQVNKSRIIIAKVDSPENMKIAGTLDFAEQNVYPKELYLHDQKMIVIGSSRANIPVYKMENGVRTEIYPSPRFSRSSVKVLIYDISNREKIELLREVELEGSYVSSRKVGAALYLVANDAIDYYRIQDNEINITPSYRDTAGEDGYVNIDCNSIRYFPGTLYSNYMIVAGINIDENETANINTYLGAGQNIYASAENLYVAVTDYSIPSGKNSYSENTQIYKFGMKDAKLTYLCKGKVSGTILNQFSMDEHNGHFRIAATKGNIWATDERISKNCMYVLDNMLSVTGSIEDMAPGEKIYSVRFMGDRAYVVTFKTVDPLFVIDLKNPAKPAILGALKIPGYSDYLHPYDENHIIGFGKDTIELSNEGTWKRDSTTAYYQGMKIALFDVSDVSNPKEKFKEIIGDRGTDSELLNNHKALLFSREKELMAFPVTVMEIEKGGNVEDNRPVYGSFSFQGAYVYNIDLEEGFKLRARISHIDEEEYKKAGDRWYRSNMNVERIIYIGDDLYTISKGMIKANSMIDMKEKGSLLIP